MAFSTKAGLGTLPVASVPFSVSLVNHALSFGWWLNILSIVQILIQVAVLRGKCNYVEIGLQTILALLYIIAAAAICLLCLGRLEGVREGSVIAALLVGNIIKAYGRLFKRVTGRRLSAPGRGPR